jgi:hypothetical protein
MDTGLWFPFGFMAETIFLHHKDEIHDKSLFVMQQPYSDPASSYYTPAFRTGIDGDARYPSYVTSNTASKYNGNVGLTTGPSLQSSQEVS